MVSWSSAGGAVRRALLAAGARGASSGVPRAGLALGAVARDAHRSMVLQPSRWQWHKFKDMLHYYVMVGAIPVAGIIFYTNVFIGPAQLQPVPEGYEPKYWEYHRHPITRFIARYIHNSPQQDYEKFMHVLDEERQKAKLVLLEQQIKGKMSEREDYQAYYYRPMVNKYLRIEKQISEDTYNRLGDDLDD